MASRDRDGNEVLIEADVRLLHAAVMPQGDALDGLKDGLIGDLRQCKFDPTRFKCITPSSDKCLTLEKLDVVRKFYKGPRLLMENLSTPGA